MPHKRFTLIAILLVLSLLPPAASPPAMAQDSLSEPSAAAEVPARDQEAVAATLKYSPVMFIENVGQFPDGARFQVRGGLGTTWLADDAIWISFVEPPDSAQRQGDGERGRPGDESFSLSPDHHVSESQQRGVNLKLTFPGANPDSRLEPFNPLDTVVSYFIGNDPDQWRPDVPVWGGVRYVDLYPGVDLEIASDSVEWSWRFVERSSSLRSSSARSAVRVRLAGANKLQLEDSRISIATPALEWQLPLPSAPFSYEVETLTLDGDLLEGVTVQGKNAVTSASAPRGTLRHAVQTSEASTFYSTFLGATGGVGTSDIAVDDSGRIYVTGTTSATDFPTTPGAFQTSYGGGHITAFVAAFSPDLRSLHHATFLGGSGEDEGNALQVDSSGVAFVTGTTNSTNFPTTSGAFQTSLRGEDCGGYPCSDAYVAVLNHDGASLHYGTYLGGRGPDTGNAIAIDTDGYAYVTGATLSVNFPVTPDAYQPILEEWDLYVTVLNPDGRSLRYSTFVGGRGITLGSAIAVDPNRVIYLTGITNAVGFPITPGAFQSQYGGGRYDAFVTVFNPDGRSLRYSSFLGGSDWDFGYAIAADASGTAFVAGRTRSADFPTTPGAFQTTLRGTGFEAYDGFLVAINPDGRSLRYSTFFGGSASDGISSISLHPSGAAYVTGSTGSTDFPTTPDGFQTSMSGMSSAFLALFAADGSSLRYSSYIGGSKGESGAALTTDTLGKAYLTGNTSSADFPISPGAFQTTLQGGGSAFVTSLWIEDMKPTLPNRLHFAVIARTR